TARRCSSRRPLEDPRGDRRRNGPTEGFAMSTRASIREISVGLIVIVALAGLIGLVSLASDGPGFLAPQRTIDVIFRDGRGIRVGSPVRVAGLDTGNVVDLDLVEVGGTLRARVRISLPANLVKKLRQDVKGAIQPALTGMSHVNIVSTGRSATPLAAGGPGTRGGACDRGGNVLLRPDHRAGRPRAGGAERHPAHDRRGAPDRGFGRAPVPADPRIAPGDVDPPPRGERGDPTGDRVHRQPDRGPD